eukprot:symbB.v1.2.012086.t1/scaffold822.1/size350215/13
MGCGASCQVDNIDSLEERVFKLQNQKLVERKKAAEDTRRKGTALPTTQLAAELQKIFDDKEEPLQRSKESKKVMIILPSSVNEGTQCSEDSGER